MKPIFALRSFLVAPASWKIVFRTLLAAIGAAQLAAVGAQASVVYALDNNIVGTPLNASDGTEPLDNWWANEFTAVAGGNRLTRVDFGCFSVTPGSTAVVSIYRVTDPGGNPALGATRLYSQSFVPVGEMVPDGSPAYFDQITLTNPVSLNVGDIFLVAISMTNVIATPPNDVYPFILDSRSDSTGSYWARSAPNTFNLDDITGAVPIDQTLTSGGFQPGAYGGHLLIRAYELSGPFPDFTYITNTGAITITGYLGSGGNVTIPSIINTYPVTTIGTKAFQFVSTLTGVTIPNSITNIGDFAFVLCSGLTNVTIGNDVTTIGNGAFESCSALTSVTIPGSVTTIGDFAFGSCSALTSVTIPDSVTSIGDSPFDTCSGLTNIVVNSGNPSYASAGGVLFNRTLTALIQHPAGLAGSYAIPDSVTSLGSGAFANCLGLTNVTIDNNVTNIGTAAFIGCSGLTSVAIPNSVISIPPLAFLGCPGLTSVTIGDSVTRIGDLAFVFCSALTRVTIPASVTSMGTNAFQNCFGLHQAYFQGNAPSVDGAAGSLDNTVFQGESGTAYYVPSTTGWGATFGGWPTTIWSSPATDFTYITNNDAITITGYTGPGGQVTIPGTINNYSVIAIGTNAFLNQTNLTSATIPSTVTRIDHNAFGLCLGLTSVTIPDSVVTIGVTAFFDSGLTNVTLPGSVTSLGDVAFGACSRLTNIDVDTANPSYASVGGVLFNRNLTTLLQCPGGLAGSYAIPDGVATIGSGAFISCYDLTNVTMPSSLTTIGFSPFFACSGLTSVTMGDRLIRIGDSAFVLCSALTRVTIPGSVTSLGTNAFANCFGLHQAYFQGNAPSVDAAAGGLDTTVFQGESGTAYYVPGTSGWGNYFGGWPTAGWYQPQPQILGTGYGLGAGTNGFQFTISWATNATVVVEASTNLQNWTPVSTNTLFNGTSLFWDSGWTNYPRRFYRVGLAQ